MNNKHAVIDIGSSTICLSVFSIKDKDIITLHYESAVLKLGMYLHGDYCFPQEAIDRINATLLEMIRIARSYDVCDIHCLATSVFRQCANAEEVVLQCRTCITHPINIISEEEEGELATLSVQHFFDLSGKKALIMDMGGGSTEMVLVNQGKMTLNQSVPFGLSKFKKQLVWEQGKAAPAQQKIQQAAAEVIQDFCDRLGGKEFDFMVMTSSTIKMIAMIRYPDVAIQDLKDKVVTQEDCEHVIERIHQGESFANIEEEKRDLVYLGAFVLKEWMKRMALEEIHICPWSIREGVLIRKLFKSNS